MMYDEYGEVITGGPAYPAKSSNGIFLGMTLRDHFAGLAMQGLLSDSNIKARPLDFAIRAYAMADAMIEYRIKEK
jgi:hypothetical protein